MENSTRRKTAANARYYLMFYKIQMVVTGRKLRFAIALDELYGTVLYTDVAKRGESHIFSLYAECVNEEYLSEGGVLDEVLGLFIQLFLIRIWWMVSLMRLLSIVKNVQSSSEFVPSMMIKHDMPKNECLN